MQIPKMDPAVMFDVTLQVSQKGGALSAQEISIRRSRGQAAAGGVTLNWRV
jgi:hypothetical protein